MADRLAQWYADWKYNQELSNLPTGPTDALIGRRKDWERWGKHADVLRDYSRKRTIRIIEEWEGWPYRIGQVYVTVGDRNLRVSPAGRFSDCHCIHCTLAFNLLYGGYHVIRIIQGMFLGWPIPLITTEPLDDLCITDYKRRR